MVAPTFGQFYEAKIHSRVLSTERWWYRQGKPYDLPLSWTSRRNILVYAKDPTRTSGGAIGLLSNAPSLSYNKAYSRLVSQLGEQSQWAVNLAEQKQSLSMIVNRSNQIRLFLHHVRRAQFPAASRALKLSFIPSGVKKSKAFANNFLEYHFGWEPLLQDIHAAVESFLNPHLPGKRPISGRGSAQGSTFVAPDTVNFTQGYRTNETSKTRLGASLSVDNPNLHLASQLGLVNPAAIAWELVPFSFVVDWFANVGQVLSSYTDFAGCSLLNQYATSFGICNSNRLDYWGDVDTYIYVSCTRVTFISGPSLEVKPFQGLSPVRGITAISLLLQKMR